jgi:hypothetical protein
MRLYFILCILLFLLSCSGQTTQKPKENSLSSKSITVSFSIDDSFLPIKNQYHVVFVSGNKSIEASIKGNELFLPAIDTNTNYTIVFRYANYSLLFKNVMSQRILTGQDMAWKFGIDNRPFNNDLGLLSTEELKTDTKIKQLQYLVFDPLEHGDGIAAVNKIE